MKKNRFTIFWFIRSLALTALVLCTAIQMHAQVDGELDLSFDPGTGANSTVKAVAIQQDGKIIIGGQFNEYDGVPRRGIARLNTNGSLDESFSSFQKQLSFAAGGEVEAISLLPDGKILVGGYFNPFEGTRWFTRLNHDGSEDMTFNQGSGFNSAVEKITVQPDGKILVAGQFTEYNGTPVPNRIARLNADGSLDATFRPDALFEGLSTRNFVLQADGKVIIVNRRFNPDGSPDPEFRVEGGDVLTVQPDGKIIKQFSGQGFPLRSLFRRNDLNGNYDTGDSLLFNIGGLSSFPPKLICQEDGKIIIAMRVQPEDFDEPVALLRLNRNFKPDIDFKNVKTFNAQSGIGWIYDMAIQQDGKIVIVGGFIEVDGIARNGIVRIHSSSNNPGPIAPEPSSPPSNLTYTEITENSLRGSFVPPPQSVAGYLVLRTLREGVSVFPDDRTTYTVGSKLGNATVVHSGSGTSFEDTGLLSCGRYHYTVFAYNGSGSSINYLRRPLTSFVFTQPGDVPEASPDLCFDHRGVGMGFRTILGVSDDGKIYFNGGFGFTFNNKQITASILRLNPDGTLDESFVIDTENQQINSISFQPDGKVIIAGNFSKVNGVNRKHIARVNIDGTLDLTFDPGIGPNEIIRSTVVQPDGKIIIAGSFSAYRGFARERIARINPDGSLDTGFTPDPQILFIENTAPLLTKEGKLIGFGRYNATNTFNSMRLNSNGTLDTSFVPDYEGTPQYLQADGKIIVYGGPRVIARLNQDGKLDNSFKQVNLIQQGLGGGGGFASTIQPDGKIILFAGLSLISDGTVTRERLARLNSDGSIDPAFTPGIFEYRSNSGAASQLFVMPNEDNRILFSHESLTGYSGYKFSHYVKFVSNITAPVVLAPEPTAQPTALLFTNRTPSSFNVNFTAITPNYSKAFSFENFDEPGSATFLSSDGTLTEVANPAPNTVNSSAVVGRYVRNSQIQYDVIFYNTNTIPDATQYSEVAANKKFYVDVYTDAPIGTEIILQLETSTATPSNYPTGRHSRYKATITQNGSWHRLPFSYFDKPDAGASASITKMSILFNSNTFTGDTYFFDNLDSYSADTGGTNQTGSPTGYIALRRQGAAPTTDPADGISYAVGNTIGDGVVAYIGNQTFFAETGKQPATVYHYKIYAFNGSEASINYNQTTPLTGNVITLVNEPGAQPTNMTFSSFTATSFNVSYVLAEGNPDGYIALQRADQPTATDPEDGVTYAANSNLGESKVVYIGNQNIFNASGLTEGTTYHYKIYSFNGSGATINYRQASPLTGSQVAGIPSDGGGGGAPLPLAIVSSSIPSSAARNESSTLSITFNRNPSSAVISYGPASSVDFVASDVPMINSTGSTWTFTIPASAQSELGVRYQYKGIDELGNIESPISLIKVSYSGDGLAIPYSSFGGNQGNYRLISIPADLENKSVNGIFGDEIGNYGDREKWRMFQYEGGRTEEISGFTNLAVGRGYWLIIRDNPGKTIASGPGRSIGSVDEPVSLSNLIPGWNLIGNPYPFRLSWSDVLSVNTQPGLGPLRVYRSGNGFSDATILNGYEGAFVFAGAAGTLMYPAAKNPSVNGRIKDEGQHLRYNTIDDDDWEVRISLQSGEIVNSLAGFGMHPLASESSDVFDDFTLPRFAGYIELNHNKTLYNTHFSRDVVPASKRHEWTFMVESSEEGPVTLSWENHYFKNQRKRLILVHVERGVQIDMAMVSSYSFAGPKASFKVLYGNSEYIRENLGEQELTMIDPYPNPSSGQLTVQFFVPDQFKHQEFSLSLVDMQGRVVGSLELGALEAGYFEKFWDLTNSSNSMPSGLHVLRLSNKYSSVYKKIIFN